jgi:chemotaxis protein methyltransferase CheR
MTLSPLAPEQVSAVAGLLRSRTGLAFGPSRQQDLEAAILKTMAHAHVADADALIGHLATDAQLFELLIAGVTVAETYFFRDPAQFEALRRLILPDLQRRLPGGVGPRLWSAGCASGEEPYSLAILLEQEGLAEHAAVVGTDISHAALARARQAVYGAWSLRGSDTSFIAQYFERRGNRFRLHDRLRRRVAFRHLNLASDDYPSLAGGTLGCDVILCRNVLIYLDESTVARVASRLLDALGDGGWLITGPSDPPLWLHARCEVVTTAAGVLYRRGERRAAVAYPEKRCADSDRAAPEEIAEPPPVLSSEPPAVASPAAVASESELEATIRAIRALANLGGTGKAVAATTAAITRYPLCPELHYLHAILLMGSGQDDEAIASLRRVIYLDRSMAVAHFALASALQRLGATAEARQAYRRALALSTARPQDEILPLSDGEPAGRLAAAARAQLATIEERAP